MHAVPLERDYQRFLSATDTLLYTYQNKSASHIFKATRSCNWSAPHVFITTRHRNGEGGSVFITTRHRNGKGASMLDNFNPHQNIAALILLENNLPSSISAIHSQQSLTAVMQRQARIF